MTDLKVYFYTNAEVGVPWPGPDADFIVNGKPKNPALAWPRFDWCAFPGFDATTDPGEADVFVVRQRLIWLSKEQIYGLPHLRSDNAHRHVFFDLGSDGDPKCFRDFPDLPAIFFRGAANKHMMRGTPTTVPWAWPVDNLTGYPQKPQGGFQYDVVYQGQDAATVRHTAKAVVETLQASDLELRTHLVITPTFWGTMPPSRERQNLRDTFLDTLHYGRLSLVPGCHHLGVTRYRFYETLSMGRVPVYIEDNGVLPFEDRIDYSRCVVFVPEADVSQIDHVLKDWLSTHSDQDIVRMGLLGRTVWERWLDRSQWAVLVKMVVQEKLSL